MVIALKVIHRDFALNLIIYAKDECKMVTFLMINPVPHVTSGSGFFILAPCSPKPENRSKT
jgi:hypothetical protein